MSRQVLIRVDESEYQGWKRRADSERRTVAGLIRYVMSRYLEPAPAPRARARGKK